MAVDVKVGECMTVGVLTLDAGKPVSEAAKLLKKSRVGSVIVLEKGKAVGIITERDITYKVVAENKNPKTTKLKSVMSKPLKVISASKSIHEAALALRNNRVKRLPVVNKKGQLVGVIAEGDLVKVYPGVIDMISEAQEIGPFKRKDHTYTGVCEDCGMYSDELRADGSKLKCGECIEEDEV